MRFDISIQSGSTAEKPMRNYSTSAVCKCSRVFIATQRQYRPGLQSICWQVWSEPEMVDAGAFEFSETSAFLEAGIAQSPSSRAHPICQGHNLLECKCWGFFYFIIK